jgi:phage shock protein PspC (stress-responsive transcriptional regulator)
MTSTTSTPPPALPSGEVPPAAPARPRLARSRTDRKIAGVAAGLAEHTGVDAVLWRVAFIALTVAGGSGVLVYALLWLLMPEADDARR